MKVVVWGTSGCSLWLKEGNNKKKIEPQEWSRNAYLSHQCSRTRNRDKIILSRPRLTVSKVEVLSECQKISFLFYYPHHVNIL